MEHLRGSTTSPMCASPRSTAISARPRISRPCSTSCPARRTAPRRRANGSDAPRSGARDRRRSIDASCAGAGSAARPRQTWPNPAVGAVVVARRGPGVVGRGWTAAGGRPHAETEALGAPASGARRHPLRDARALLASRQDAALRRRHHRRPASRAWCRRWRIPTRGSPARAMRGCAPPASRSTSALARRGRAARMPATSAASRRAPARDPEACGLADGKAGAAGRRPADHRRGGARVHLMRAHERRHPGRHRHRAGRRSAADLPAAGHGGALAGARRARQQAAHSPDRRLRAPRDAGPGCSSTAAPARPSGAECRAGRRGLARRRRRRGPSICRGAARSGAARHHAADGRGRADRGRPSSRPTWSTRPRCSAGAERHRRGASMRWKACRSGR